MRLFVAIQPAEKFLNSLSLLQDRLRRAGVGGRYIDEHNLHMTLAFIGEWPENISELLPAVKKPFPIVLSQIAVFPGSDVLCALTEPSEALDNTARAVRHSLADAGISFDKKAFFPHITLVRSLRLPKHVDLTQIKVPRAAMTVNEIALYRSDRGKNGMVYTVIGASGRTEG